MIEWLVLALFPFLMIYAAVSDLLTMRIPNRVVVLLLAAFLLCSALAGISLQELTIAIGVGAGVLLISFLMFSLGWVGGGDAKLAAATGVWLGFGCLFDYALLASVYGGVLTFAILGLRSMPLPAFALGWEWLTRLHDRRTGVPYGIALAAAGLMVYPSSPLWKAVF